MITSNILGRINGILNELSESERKIGQFILDHPEKTVTMKSKELSKAVGISTASVSRFCKSIDILNFNQLKIKLSSELTNDFSHSYADVNEGEDLHGIKVKLLGNAIQSMTETIEQMDSNKIIEVAQSIFNANVIYVFGIGASGLVAENIKQKWGRLGKLVIFEKDTHLLLANISSAPKNSLFWFISNSGKTKEVVSLAKLAKKQKQQVLAITQFGKNPLAELSDLVLQTSKTREINERSAATSSLHSQFMIIDVLLYYSIANHYEASTQMIQQSRGFIEQYEKLQ